MNSIFPLKILAPILILSSLALPVLAANAPPATQVSVTLNEKPQPKKPGYFIVKATAKLSGKVVPLACGVFLPPAYFKTRAPMPMVMTLHTRGPNGADGRDELISEGLGLLVARGKPDDRATGEKPRNAINLNTDAQFIALVPQCPDGYGWETPPVAHMLAELITQIGTLYHADQDRAYLTGFSYGGSSTWSVAMEVPDRFAAIIPLDARATQDPKNDLQKLKDLKIFMAVGANDPEFLPEAQRMRDALNAIKHPSFSYHVVPGGNHWCYGSIYNDPEFWKRLFTQNRKKLSATRPTTTQPSIKNR